MPSSTGKSPPMVHLEVGRKNSFLQTEDTQRKRQIFGIPVAELQEAIGLPPGKAAQFLKAAYGLTMAPKEFYQHVDGILAGLKLTRSKVDPAIWVLKEKNTITGNIEVCGLELWELMWMIFF